VPGTIEHQQKLSEHVKEWTEREQGFTENESDLAGREYPSNSR
jgi:hypothetical protein